MSLQVILRPLAEADLLEAQEWYEERREGLGAEFRREADRAFTLIGQLPLAYPVVYRGLRRAVLRRFPYAVYFLASQEQVVVVACLHMARSPRAIRNRG